MILDHTNSEKEKLENKNNVLKYVLATMGVVLLLAILLFTLSGGSNYESGMKYLNQKQYSEAIFEFSKVEPDEKEFKMAQSKINYINGLKSHEQGMKSESLEFLAMVDPLDEYYRESQLMIDKTKMEYKQVNLEALNEQISRVKDKVIIQEQSLIHKSAEVSNSAEGLSGQDDLSSTNSNTEQILTQLLGQVTQFENQYQSALDASTDVRKSYLNKVDSLHAVFNNKITSKGADSRMIQVYNLSASWMQKRMNHIAQLISGRENESSITTKQDGDRAYDALLKLIKS
jgi:hypothetical protein